MKDDEIIKEILAGDRDSYAALVETHHPRVEGLCRSILGNAAEAQDAAQDVFIKAYKSLSKFRGGASFATWTYRIAVNHCRDLLRSRSRRRAESLDAILEDGRDGLARLMDGSPAQGKSMEDKELIQRVLSLLSEDERVVLLLREKELFTYDEIAAALDCSLDAVKSRLRRARIALSEKLKHFWERENV